MKRTKLLIPLVGAIALTAVCARSGGGALTPKIAAKQAEAQRVLEQISAIDEQLNSVSERYDGARVRLDKLRKDLASEQIALAGARVRFHHSQQRAAKLLVWMYTSNHTSSLDVILGAHSLGELLALTDAEHQVSSLAARIAHQTENAKHSLSVKVVRLDRDRAAAAAAVHQLAHARTEILAGLAERRRLLASVQKEVNHLEAVERARQARLAAEARARLAAALAAQRKAAAEAAAARRAELASAARAKAAEAAAAANHKNSAEVAGVTTPAGASGATGPDSASAPPPSTAVLTPVTAPPVATTPAVTTTPVVTIPVVTTPAFIPSGPLPAGHPEAAQLALAYLGVPYLWGGSTPTGFDCSGLVSYVYAQLGVALPHFAAAQWGFGVAVPTAELQPGDLVFFDKLDHVGIYLGNDEFIDAPHTGSFVRIDTLSEPWYQKHYVGARRI
jgi:cell wall-associated NlpC family hydrolase